MVHYLFAQLKEEVEARKDAYFRFQKYLRALMLWRAFKKNLFALSHDDYHDMVLSLDILTKL